MGFPDIIPIVPGGLEVDLPELASVKQRFPDVRVADPAAAVSEALSGIEFPDVSEMSIAITAGSRGIPDFVPIVRTLVNELRARGARPFIVPAMGSHGGATPEGQVRV